VISSEDLHINLSFFYDKLMARIAEFERRKGQKIDFIEFNTIFAEVHQECIRLAEQDKLLGRVSDATRADAKVLVNIIYKETVVSYPAPPNFNY